MCCRNLSTKLWWKCVLKPRLAEWVSRSALHLANLTFTVMPGNRTQSALQGAVQHEKKDGPGPRKLIAGALKKGCSRLTVQACPGLS